ncbi:MAG: hypothetical protein NTW30_05910 [Candidatus Aenigmarchaeota archaeon]|nr:hypothetical protein [Candidatus Aenigmarchaeota archaeon]
MKNIDKRSNVICRINDRKQFRVDGCIRDMVYLLNFNGIQTSGSCCGHNRYPLSIVYRTCHNGVETFYELISGVKIPRTRNFYVKDKGGFYYIPEALEALYEDV